MERPGWWRLFQRVRSAEEFRARYAELYRLACLAGLPLWSRRLDRTLLVRTPVLWRSRLLPVLWCCATGLPLVLLLAWIYAGASMPDPGSALPLPPNNDGQSLYISVLAAGAWLWAVTRYRECDGGLPRRLRATAWHGFALALLALPALLVRLVYSHQLATLVPTGLPATDPNYPAWVSLGALHRQLWQSGWRGALMFYDDRLLAAAHLGAVALLALATSHGAQWGRMRNAWQGHAWLRAGLRSRPAGTPPRGWMARADRWLLLHHPAVWVSAPLRQVLLLLAVLAPVTAIPWLLSIERSEWLTDSCAMNVVVCCFLMFIAIGRDGSGTSRVARYPARLCWTGAAQGLELRGYTIAAVASWFAWPGLLLLVPLGVAALAGLTAGPLEVDAQNSFNMVYMATGLVALVPAGRLALVLGGRRTAVGVWLGAWALVGLPAGAVALLGTGETRAVMLFLLVAYAAAAIALHWRSALHAGQVPPRLELAAWVWLAAMPGTFLAVHAAALSVLAGDVSLQRSGLGLVAYGTTAVASGVIALVLCFGPLLRPALRILVRASQQPRT